MMDVEDFVRKQIAVRLSFALFLFFLDFAIGSFLHLVLHKRAQPLLT